MNQPKGKLKEAYNTISILQFKLGHVLQEAKRAKGYLELDSNKNYLAIQVLEKITNL